MLKKTILLLFCFCLATLVKGQTTILIRHYDKDSAFIKEFYGNHLILRAYESTKFNNFKLIDGSEKLVYRPNDHNNVGVGFNYRFLSINLGFYVPAISKSSSLYGHTHDVDLQSHLYVHKFIIDIYGADYHGYYLANSDATTYNLPNEHVLLRPDIITKNFDVAFQYVFNDKRFSYNAPFYHNEIQRKSAGSFLVGAGVYHTNANGDSAFTPANVRYADFFHDFKFNQTTNAGIDINGGYAYTLVIKKLFFVTAMLSGGAGINYASLANSITNQAEEKTGAEINVTGKFAAGYNSDKFFAGVTYIRLVNEDNAIAPHMWQEGNTGNFRFTVAQRFRLKKNYMPKSDLIKIE